VNVKRNFMQLHLLLILLCATSAATFGQVNPNNDRQTVLRHDTIGNTYVFDRSKKDNYNKTEITYLGELKTKDGRIFKVLISRWYWGISPRATSRIVLFNNRNQYLGNYYVGMTYDLPGKIENNALVFDNKERDGCDPTIVTRISFANGLPEKFFLECKNKMGDIYSFGDE
jgi:hypothetical protein